MFQIQSVFPAKSVIKGAVVARGYFQATTPPTLSAGQVLEAFKGEQRIGQVRFNSVLHARWSTPESVLYHLSLTSDLPWEILAGCTLQPLTYREKVLDS